MEIVKSEELKLSSLLLTLGVLPSVVGFEYIKSAVLSYDDYSGNMSAICSAIASENFVSKCSVERDIRTALLSAQQRGWLMRLNDLLGINFIAQDERIKAKEFIALVAEYIKISKLDQTSKI